MNSTTYKLSSTGPLVLRDYTDPDYRKMLNNYAESGDYLISLAAELGHIAVKVKKTNPEAFRLLVKLARDLSYIDDKYTIIKKPKNNPNTYKPYK